MSTSLPCRVSIICPVYNVEPFLNETIGSVLSQTYPHWELLLVVDFKSTDQSLRIAKAWSLKDPRIFVFESEKNLGVANNRNNGLHHSKGELIAFLDSDDLWLPQKLEKQVKLFENQSINFTYHSYQQISKTSQLLPVIRMVPPQVTYYDLLKTNSIGCLSVMIRKSLLLNHSFQTSTPHEDYILWLEILKEIPLAHGLSDILAYYRVLPHSRSGNKKRAALDRWFIYRKVLHLSLIKSIYYFIFYTFYALTQRLKI